MSQQQSLEPVEAVLPINGNDKWKKNYDRSRKSVIINLSFS